MRSRFSLALVLAVIASLVSGSMATAVPVTPISNAQLNGSGDRVWDPANDSGGCLNDDTAYTPVDDGSVGLQTDAFDGGLTLIVDGRPFVDGNDTGNEVGEQLTVGPTAFHGVNVIRQDRAIGRSLRSLIKFTNTRAFAQTLEVYFDSDLGSDDGGEIRATSTGDLQVTRADRWFVTSDSDTAPSDPVLTFVTHGKGSIASRADSPAFGDLTECVITHYTVRVPAHRVRYVLAFAEMNPTNEIALNNVGKWNSQKLNATLLDDIGANAKAKVVNWDLT